MSAIVSALDNATFKRHGENAHVEYGWSHNLKEKIVQFFFQLVRTKGNGMEDLKKNLNDILFRLKGHVEGPRCPKNLPRRLPEASGRPARRPQTSQDDPRTPPDPFQG